MLDKTHGQSLVLNLNSTSINTSPRLMKSPKSGTLIALMESFGAMVASVQQLIEPHPLTFIFVTLSVLALVVRVLRPASGNQPPAMSDRIPYVSNTYQYLTDMKSFMKRATYACWFT